MAAIEEYAEYELMRQSGAGPANACSRALASGTGRIWAIRMLRAVYALSLEDSTEVATHVDAKLGDS